MKCDYCDSKFKEMPEDQVCPNCGATILTMEERKAMMKFPDPPVGTYKTAAGRMEIGVESVTFYQRFLLTQKVTTIFYNEIVAASFEKGRGLINGFLCLRDYKTRNYPLMSSCIDDSIDISGVLFYEQDNETFERLYRFFQQCANTVCDIVGNIAEQDCGAPLGRFPSHFGYIEVDRDKVTIVKEDSRPSIQVIPYQEIVEVAYQKAEKWRVGGLCISTVNHPKPIAKVLSDARLDDTSIGFGEFANDIMFKVYSFIKKQMNRR